MKHLIKSVVLAGALISLMISGCTKTSEVVPETTTPTAAAAPTITISDGYGALVPYVQFLTRPSLA